jgi:hypothetical protein
MARIYAGELSKLDEEVLESVKRLPDDFWVLAEFNIGRNVDLFIIRPKQYEPSTLIVTELKRSTRPVRGSIDGMWEKMNEAGEWEEIPASAKDLNHYWQAVNTANALADWLWNFQRLYLDGEEIRPPDQFRVWPNLLLLSPSGVQHRLPLGPSNKYGRWFYAIEPWLQHIVGWNSRMGISLTHDEVARLVEALQLEPIWIPETRPLPQPSLTPSSDSNNEITAFMSWLARLEERVSRLEELAAQGESHESREYIAK